MEHKHPTLVEKNVLTITRWTRALTKSMLTSHCSSSGNQTPG